MSDLSDMEMRSGLHQMPHARAAATEDALILPRLEAVLLFAAACYAIFGWALFHGSAGLNGAAIEDLSQSNKLNQAIWITFFLVAAGFIVSRVLAGVRVHPTLMAALLVGYLTLSLASVLWALSPDIAARRVIQQFIVVFLFVGVTAFARDQLVVLNAVYLSLATAILINVCLLPVVPPTSLGYSGLYPQKNLLGVVCAVTFIFSVFLMLSPHVRFKAWIFTILLLSFALLVLSRSKTSLGLAVLCPLVAGAVFLMSRAVRTSLRLSALAITVAVLALFGVVTVLAGVSADQISLLLFDDTTFTGRTTIWDFVVAHIDMRPWLGWGYQSFWAAGPASPNLRTDSFLAGLNQAHNGYLDILLETGATGLVIMTAFLVSLLGAIERRWKARRDVSLLLLSLVLLGIAHNFLESSLTRGYSPLWVVLLIVAGCSMSVKSYRVRRAYP